MTLLNQRSFQHPRTTQVPVTQPGHGWKTRQNTCSRQTSKDFRNKIYEESKKSTSYMKALFPYISCKNDYEKFGNGRKASINNGKEGRFSTPNINKYQKYCSTYFGLFIAGKISVEFKT